MRYLIFGPGRVGKNVHAWLTGLGHQVTLVARANSHNELEAQKNLLEAADIIAAALPDGSIAEWYGKWKKVIGEKPAIHFSGALSIEGMHGYHPLYSFPNTILPVEVFPTIAFACPENSPKEGTDFSDIFPGAENPTFTIKEEDRARYHALAVLSGNFVSYIWNTMAPEYDKFLPGQSAVIMESYIKSIVERFLETPENSLTGPIARKDEATAHKNMAALKEDQKLHALYTAFIENAWPEFPEK